MSAPRPLMPEDARPAQPAGTVRDDYWVWLGLGVVEQLCAGKKYCVGQVIRRLLLWGDGTVLDESLLKGWISVHRVRVRDLMSLNSDWWAWQNIFKARHRDLMELDARLGGLYNPVKQLLRDFLAADTSLSSGALLLVNLTPPPVEDRLMLDTSVSGDSVRKIFFVPQEEDRALVDVEMGGGTYLLVVVLASAGTDAVVCDTLVGSAEYVFRIPAAPVMEDRTMVDAVLYGGAYA